MEYEPCNTQPCPEGKKLSGTTPVNMCFVVTFLDAFDRNFEIYFSMDALDGSW